MTSGTATNLYALVDQWARQRPEAPYLCEEGGPALNYGAFDALSARMALGLDAAHIAPGERVANALPKGAMALALHFACLRRGIVCVPLNPASPRAEALRILADAACRGLVASPGFSVGPRDVPPGLACRTLAADGGGDFLPTIAAPSGPMGHANLPADALAVILYTSGSTGAPKGVMLSHRALLTNIELLQPVLGCGPDDVMLHSLPVFHSHGLSLAVNCVTAAGGSILLQPRFHPERVVDALPRATMFTGVPAMYRRMLDQPGLARGARNMRLFMCSSAHLPDRLLSTFQETTGKRLLEIYGLTETGSLATSETGLAGSDRTLFPLRDVRIRIGQGEPSERIGPLSVQRPDMASGYWNNGRQHPLPMTEQGYATGDIVESGPGGGFRLLARAHDVINSGGFKIYPKELEAVLLGVSGVKDCVVIPVPHPVLEEVPIAILTADRAMNEEALREQAAEELGRHKIPRKFIFMDSLPQLPSGKPDLTRLRQAYRHMFQ